MIDRPTPAPNVVVEDLDDDVCLYRADIDEVLVLNQTAGDVWRLADGQLTVAAIAHRLARFYGADAAELHADVRSLVDDLTARGYLVDQPAVS
ncbi:MAG TPA: PqqD family protein [Jatrophihabitantaceae bacterium]|jgi:hypothetical protein